MSVGAVAGKRGGSSCRRSWALDQFNFLDRLTEADCEALKPKKR